MDLTPRPPLWWWQGAYLLLPNLPRPPPPMPLGGTVVTRHGTIYRNVFLSIDVLCKTDICYTDLKVYYTYLYGYFGGFRLHFRGSETDASAPSVCFTDSDEDAIRLQLEGDRVLEFVNGSLELPDMERFDVDVKERSYTDEQGSGHFKDGGLKMSGLGAERRLKAAEHRDFSGVFACFAMFFFFFFLHDFAALGRQDDADVHELSKAVKHLFDVAQKRRSMKPARAFWMEKWMVTAVF